MPQKLSLDAIELVDTIARTGSFAAAAEQLHKVPSTISYTVSKLEEQLGFPLFKRQGPRVSLTPAGEALLEDGRSLLVAAQLLESRLRQIATGYEDELRFVHDSMIPTRVFTEDLRAFEDLQCGTRLRIGVDTLSGPWEALRDGRADLVLAAGDLPALEGLEALPVGSVAFDFCVAPTHPLAFLQRPLAEADLVAHTAVVVGDGARHWRDRTVGVLQGQRRLTVPSMEAKIDCQIAGLGYGFVPHERVERALAERSLVALSVAAPRPPERFWLAWHAGAAGEALKWWRQRLGRTLMPALLREG